MVYGDVIATATLVVTMLWPLLGSWLGNRRRGELLAGDFVAWAVIAPSLESDDAETQAAAVELLVQRVGLERAEQMIGGWFVARGRLTGGESAGLTAWSSGLPDVSLAVGCEVPLKDAGPMTGD